MSISHILPRVTVVLRDLNNEFTQANLECFFILLLLNQQCRQYCKYNIDTDVFVKPIQLDLDIDQLLCGFLLFDVRLVWAE